MGKTARSEKAGEATRTVCLGGAANGPNRAWWRRLAGALGGAPDPAAGAALGSAADGIPSGPRYDAARELSRGGMGIIYRVDDRLLHRESAMKVALPYIIRDPRQAAAFWGEARITAALEHPNIVPVHDLGRTPEGGLPFYTMKLLDGQPFNQILERLRKGDPEARARFTRHQRLTVFRKICDAVQYAHVRGVIHRDIKPENIMVGPFGEAILMDWGLAKRLNPPEPEPVEPAPGAALAATLSGMIKGTPAYMAPEQARGCNGEIDLRTDIFLLGATLYHIICFRPPYEGKTAEEVVARAALANPSSPCEVAPGEQLPEELCRIVRKAMAPQKDERYASVAELSADLDDLMAGHTPGTRRCFAAGDWLMREGESGNEAYVILRGRVEVCRNGDHGTRQLLCALGPGDGIGEMALLTGEPRSAGVRAVEETEVEVVTAERIQSELRKLSPWMGRLVQSLAQRLRQANEHAHPWLLADCSASVARQFLLEATWRQRRDAAAAPAPADLLSVVSCQLGIPEDKAAAAWHGWIARQAGGVEPPVLDAAACARLTGVLDGAT
ncbi:MAG: serine/threonine-protein kinase [Lentisphaeria bacterium]